MICYKESQIIVYVIGTVLATIVVYCLFVKPQVNYENIYIGKQNDGHSIGGHLSSHSSTITAAHYQQAGYDNQNFKLLY